MNYTGVYATEEEFTDLKNLVARGWKSGDVVIVTSVMEGMRKDSATVDERTEQQGFKKFGNRASDCPNQQKS